MNKAILTLTLLLLSSCTDPMYEVKKAMSYQTDLYQYGVKEKWVANCPKKGDCEDMALCLLQKFKERGDDVTDSTLILILTPSGAGKNYNHAIVRHNGKYYDPTGGYVGQLPKGKIHKLISYNEALEIVNKHKNK